MAFSSVSPNLEVWPPSPNNQGLVKYEFKGPSETLDDGTMLLKLERGVSVEGRVYAADQKEKAIPALILAWRNSLFSDRPDVQFESNFTPSEQGSEGTNDSYVLWLNQGFNYTFYISPNPPYDALYPPLVMNREITDHLKMDFVLPGKDQLVEVKGVVLDATGRALGTYNDPQGNPLKSSIRVRAYEINGQFRSTVGETEPDTGNFTLWVPPAGAESIRTYKIRIENIPGNVLIPNIECSEYALGISSSSTPGVQSLGTIQLPSFRFPKLFKIKVKGQDGVPVPGASVTFHTDFAMQTSKASQEANCSASYERTEVTDVNGKLEVQLLPANGKNNQIYSVSIVSPSGSPYASRVIKSMEIGPSEGTLADINLAPRNLLEGQIIDDVRQEPVNGVFITAQSITADKGDGWVPPQSKSTATTDEEGRFTMYLDAGDYHFEVRPEPTSGLPKKDFWFTVSQGKQSHVFNLPAPRIIVGTVLDPNGDFLPNATVQIYNWLSVALPKSEKISSNLATAITDAKGFFKLIISE